MKSLIINKQKQTPEVILDPSKGVFKIAGNSLPENPGKFYQPIVDWFEEYALSPAGETVLEINLTYFNTASAKMLYDVLYALKGVEDHNGTAKVRWHFYEEDLDMEDMGRELEDMLDIPFEYITHKER